MDSTFIGAIGCIILFVLIFLGLDVGFAMLAVGFVGIGIFSGLDAGISILNITPYATASSYSFVVLPLFIFMGLLAYEGGLVTDLFDVFYKLLGNLRGGLAMAVIIWCGFFSAMTGESLSASIIMSKIAYPEMKKFNYNLKFSAGTIAAGGTLGILIPPSNGFVLYGIITGTSIGKLLIAGILPGILLTLLYLLCIYVLVKIKPSLAPAKSVGFEFSLIEKLKGLQATLPVFLTFLIVLGGIYAGIFTPMESAAVGVILVIVIVLIKRRLKKKNFFIACKESIQSVGMVFLILIGALVFNYFIATSQLPMKLTEYVLSLNLSQYMIFALVVVLLLALGCVMDVPAMIVLTIPILFPIIVKLGFDPIWFGVISVIISEAGAITPPVGMNVYVVAGTIKEISLFDIFSGIWPYFFVLCFTILVLTIFPNVCLFLPNQMK